MYWIFPYFNTFFYILRKLPCSLYWVNDGVLNKQNGKQRNSIELYIIYKKILSKMLSFPPLCHNCPLSNWLGLHKQYNLEIYLNISMIWPFLMGPSFSYSCTDFVLYCSAWSPPPKLKKYSTPMARIQLNIYTGISAMG